MVISKTICLYRSDRPVIQTFKALTDSSHLIRLTSPCYKNMYVLILCRCSITVWGRLCMSTFSDSMCRNEWSSSSCRWCNCGTAFIIRLPGTWWTAAFRSPMWPVDIVLPSVIRPTSLSWHSLSSYGRQAFAVADPTACMELSERWSAPTLSTDLQFQTCA